MSQSGPTSAEMGITQKDMGVKPKAPQSQEAQPSSAGEKVLTRREYREAESRAKESLDNRHMEKLQKERQDASSQPGGSREEPSPKTSLSDEKNGKDTKVSQGESQIEDELKTPDDPEAPLRQTRIAALESKLEEATDRREKGKIQRELMILKLPDMTKEGKYHLIARRDALKVLIAHDMGEAAGILEGAMDDIEAAYRQAELDLISHKVSSKEAVSIIKKMREQDSSWGYLLKVWATKAEANPQKWLDLDNAFFGRRIAESEVVDIIKDLGDPRYIDWRKKTKTALLLFMTAFLAGTMTGGKESMDEGLAPGR